MFRSRTSVIFFYGKGVIHVHNSFGNPDIDHSIHHGRHTYLGRGQLCRCVQHIHDNGRRGIFAFGRGDVRQRGEGLGINRRARGYGPSRVEASRKEGIKKASQNDIPVHLKGMSFSYSGVSALIDEPTFRICSSCTMRIPLLTWLLIFAIWSCNCISVSMT